MTTAVAFACAVGRERGGAWSYNSRMRRVPITLVAGLATLSLLGACGSSSSSGSGQPTRTTAAGGGTADTKAPTGSTQAPAGGKVDCATAKLAMTGMIINWQVVIGLAKSPVSEWANVPIGTLPQFGAQLATLTGALGSDADAAASLKFMTGANDIVTRGRGGDTAAEADLNTYLGTDLTANITKQLPLSIAYSKLGC